MTFSTVLTLVALMGSGPPPSDASVALDRLRTLQGSAFTAKGKESVEHIALTRSAST